MNSVALIKKVFTTHIVFPGRALRLSQSGQEAEDCARSGEWLLLRVPDVLLELPRHPDLQPDHHDQHLGLGRQQGAPLPGHLLTLTLS